jgi:hypothetical protein
MLSSQTYSSKELWKEVKPLVRMYESENACLIFDDTIIEKPYTDENEIISWHWDHIKNRSVKGINLLTAFYHTESPIASEPLRVPVGFECIKKTEYYIDDKTGKETRKSPITKNEMMRAMIEQSVKLQHLKFSYILADSWFSSCDNMLFIHKLNKVFHYEQKK